MTELFETGRRILAHGRRLFAAPPLAELPTAYASLLRDPGELIEELWGGVEHAEPAHDGEPPRLARKSGGGGVTTAEPLPSAAQWLLNPTADVPQTPTVASKAVPLRLPENRPRPGTAPSPAPLSSAAGRVSQPGAVSSQPPLELAPERETRELQSDSYRSQPVASEQPAKIVEWPATRPAAAAAVVGSAELATPGNVLQKMEEEFGGEPELLRLRGQLEVEEEKRQLRQERPVEVKGAKAEASRARVDSSSAPTAQTTATSFAPLTQLLSKNVAREETTADLAPHEPEVINTNDSPITRVRAEEPGRADVERADERGASRGETGPLVEEVLEELYERLRLEFSRTYGTTGG